MVVIAHEGGRDSVRESALQVDWEKNHLPHRGLGSISVLHLAFWLDVLPAELSPPEKATPKPNKGKSSERMHPRAIKV